MSCLGPLAMHRGSPGSALHCKSGLVPNQELLQVRSGWHGINLKAYSSTIYFAYHTFGYYKIKQTTLVLNKGKSNLNFPDARTRICHAVQWPSPTSWSNASTGLRKASKPKHVVQMANGGMYGAGGSCKAPEFKFALPILSGTGNKHAKLFSLTPLCLPEHM